MIALLFDSAFGGSREPSSDLVAKLDEEMQVDGMSEEAVEISVETKKVAFEPSEPALNALAAEKTEADAFGISMETQTYKHLQTYPIVESWIKIYHWVPQSDLISSFVREIAYSGYLREYTAAVDRAVNGHLDRLDKNAPFVTTLRMRDIRNIIFDNPMHYAFSGTHNSIVDASELAKTRIFEPARKTVYSARGLRDQYIDLHSQPILRSQLDPCLKRINARLMDIANTYFPPDKDKNEFPISYATFDPKTNELSYTIRIINSALVSFRPFLRPRLNEMAQFPSKSWRHIATLFDESRRDRGDGRIVVLLASLETIRVLINESLSGSLFVTFPQSHTIAGELVEPEGKDI